MTRMITIDCSGIKTPDELWQRYLEIAQPENASLFGRNLDAFWDAIEGGGPGWPGEAQLIFTNTRDLASLRLAGAASFLDGLRRVAKDATRTRIDLI